MQPAVSTSIIATIIVVFVPALQDVFGFTNIPGYQWGYIIGARSPTAAARALPERAR
jgi:hypothetical protein